jgi:DNA polymerase III subunit alpha
MASFIHLHNHSDFSLLQSSQSIESIVDRAKSLSMPSIALTEKGNLFSMIDFYKYANKNNIKPIIGCEIKIKHHIKASFSIVLLAKNVQGYLNLMKLVSLSHINTINGKPMIEKDILIKHKNDLIALSSGLNGEITHYASIGDYQSAYDSALAYQQIFESNFYLEIQNHGIESEIKSHEILNKLSSDLSIPLVATNDTYYTNKEDAESCDIIRCIGSGHNIHDPNRPISYSNEYYIKTNDQMCELFKDYPQAIENSIKIASECNIEINMGELFLPPFSIPKESKSSNADEYLYELCSNALPKKYSKVDDIITQRLNYELDIISKMGFASYFLITQDFVQYARENDIPVGPGRGSAVGSLVSYLTGITNLDPLKYNLIFERFLNPDRITMPDIDIDFCIEGREKVINYIKERYGEKSVAQIITFGSMKAKSVIRDVGRVLGMSYGEVDKIAKMIPDDLKMTIDKAQKMNKDLAKLIKQDSSCKNLITQSQKLEGLHRHASTHAAGIVIAPGPLMQYVPLFKNPSTHDITTQIEMNSLEEMGLLKMDFLGLRNLTVINKTTKMIKKNYGTLIDIDNIDLCDAEVYKLFASGNTIGIFQFESRGMRDYLKKLKPTSIEDLIAMNSLYRPGPMANIPEFIDRKNNNKKIEYLHPELESILKETNGIIVYQEQVMQIGSIIGGFTLAQSDEMRKAMGKKKKDLMATFKIDFIKGAEDKGLSQDLAIEIFDLLAKFAEYGFNKSHSAAYSVIAYQTAWLKTHYPSEFMASNLSSDLLNTDSIIKLLRNTKTLKINIISPNVNTSSTEFISTDNSNISYGLAGIKNVGYKSIEQLVDYRLKNGEFKSIFDLCKIGSQGMNKKVLESLIKAGACDELEGNRAQQYSLINHALKFGQKYNEEINSSQSSLFSSEVQNTTYTKKPLPKLDEWSETEKLNNEKNVLGFYLSGNPLDRYADDLKTFTNFGFQTDKSFNQSYYKVGGRIFEAKVLYDKKNNPWCISRLECYNGNIIDLFTFSDIYIKYKDFFINDNIVYIEAEPSRKGDDDSFKVITKKVYHLSEIRSKFSNNVNIKIDFEVNNQDIINDLYDIATEYPGTCNLILHIVNNKGVVKKIPAENLLISNKSSCVKILQNKIGTKNVWIS